MSTTALRLPLPSSPAAPSTPQARSPPISTAAPPVKFAVIGEGDLRSIVGYESSSAMTCSPKRPENAGGSWDCPSCFYRNADGWNLKCSMCGSILEQDQEPAEEQQVGDCIITSPTTNVVLVSRQSSSRSSISSSGRPAMRRLTWRDKSMSFGSLLGDVREGEEVTHGRPPTPPSKGSSSSGPWTCDGCTFVNTNPIHLSCEVCGTKKPKDAASAANSHASLREFFNSRSSFVGSSNSLTMKEQIEALQAFEERTLKKEQMDEIIEHQRRLIAEFSASQAALSAVTENETVSPGRDGYVDDETLRRARMEMQKSSGDLLEMEQMHFAEREEQDAMEEFLNRRKAEIEAEEGIVLCQHTVKPGAQSVSAQEHQWRAQSRMLRQWRQQWNLRDEELRQIRDLHLLANGSPY